MPKKGGRRRKRRTHVIDHPNAESDKLPKSFVFKMGKVPPAIQTLVQDMRRTMAPYTAEKLRDNRKNTLKDFIHVGAPLGVTHFLIFTATEKHTNLKIARLPRGPTLSFHVEGFTLMRHMHEFQRHPVDPSLALQHKPLVVLNNFASPEDHIQLLNVMFQSIFPPIDIQTVKLSECRRVVLFNFDKETNLIEFRQYVIRATPMGLTKSVKTLVKSKIPNLAKLNDISEYILGAHGGATSESEIDDESTHITMTEGFHGRGHQKETKSAIRLAEIGPRLTLKLIKVEREVCEGDILYHAFVSKTPEEAAKAKAKREQHSNLKRKRREEQDSNVARKAQERDLKHVRKLERQSQKHIRTEDAITNTSEDKTNDVKNKPEACAVTGEKAPKGKVIRQRNKARTRLFPMQKLPHIRVISSQLYRSLSCLKTPKALSTTAERPTSEAIRITRLGMWINLSMAVSKGAIGAAIPSNALMADAAHSFSDLLSDFVTLWSVRIARCPPDPQHPYGYGKYEAVGSLTVGTLLLFCGGGIAIDSFHSLQSIWMETNIPCFWGISSLEKETQLAVAASIAGVSITAKELLYRVTIRIGKRINSKVLIANAWHHRTDALSSIVALGTLESLRSRFLTQMVGGIMGSIAGAPFLDPAAGLIVAAMIAKTGVSVSLDSVRELTDKNVEDDVLDLSRNVEDVLHVSHVRARRMGPYTLVDLRVYVHARASVSMAQQITTRLRAEIVREMPTISEVSVHIDVMDRPDATENFNASMPSYREIKQDVRNALQRVNQLVGITHVGTHWAPTKENALGTFVDVTIVVHDELSVREARRVALEAQRFDGRIQAI
ncbi:unnamed protein product [Albugo candida]|uniref:Brix domain-containing protein n=1 Tax=Albugo candida TaxID=65357 RepID=A0A024G143_9STRA|nr:unnamed protein product [Albugo candida]|eukprot:CCI40365.1 unnamed protein product [Albugo candida]